MISKAFSLLVRVANFASVAIELPTIRRPLEDELGVSLLGSLVDSQNMVFFANSSKNSQP